MNYILFRKGIVLIIIVFFISMIFNIFYLPTTSSLNTEKIRILPYENLKNSIIREKLLSNYPSIKKTLSQFDPNNASPKPTIINTPDYLNWRDYEGHDWTTPAKNQKLGSYCYAFCALSVLECVINIREGNPDLDLDLSEQYVLSCLPSAGSQWGGDPYLAFLYMMETSERGNFQNGIIPESCFPYQASYEIPCSDKCSDWEDYLIPISGCGYWLTNGSLEDRAAIKTQIMQGGPIATGIYVNLNFSLWGYLHHKPDDYYKYSKAPGINHCVVIVGWKDDPSIENGGYWICKNSWGSFWGNNGFFNIEYGSLNIDNSRIIWVDYDPESINSEPIANAGDFYHGEVGQIITFNGNRCYDNENNIITYFWDFGDGTNSTGMIAHHAYSEKGIYTVTITITDDIGQQAKDVTAALIEVWTVGDSWTYQMDFYLDSGKFLNKILEGSSKKLVYTVENETDDSYLLRFNGNFNGKISNPFYRAKILKSTKLTGHILINKSNFAVKNYSFELKGKMIHYIVKTIPLPIPFQLDIKLLAEFIPEWTFLSFPFFDDKTDFIPMSTLLNSISMVLYSSIINQTKDYSHPVGCLLYYCNQEQIYVKAGVFESFHIFTQSGDYMEMDYHFAPAAGNIVKLSIGIINPFKIDENIFNLQLELKSTNVNLKNLNFDSTINETN